MPAEHPDELVARQHPRPERSAGRVVGDGGSVADPDADRRGCHEWIGYLAAVDMAGGTAAVETDSADPLPIWEKT
jgi:hypothetical protein